MQMTRASGTAAMILCVLSVLHVHMAAFNAAADLVDDKRAMIQAKRVDAVRTFLELDPREEAAFWPLYEEYRADMARTNDGLARLIRTYAGSSDHLSDQQTEQLLSEFLQLKEKAIQVHYQYIGRFRQILPGRKLVRLFQIEHKIDAAIQADLAEVVPLVK